MHVDYWKRDDLRFYAVTFGCFSEDEQSRREKGIEEYSNFLNEAKKMSRKVIHIFYVINEFIKTQYVCKAVFIFTSYQKVIHQTRLRISYGLLVVAVAVEERDKLKWGSLPHM